MTENQKRLAIIAFVIILVLIFTTKTGQRIRNMVTQPVENILSTGNNIFGDIESDGTTLEGNTYGDITIDGRGQVVIPDFGNFTGPETLSAIGACCADCSEVKSVMPSYRYNTGPTIVFNEGNRGPNVFNYWPNNRSQNPYLPPLQTRAKFG